MLKSEISAIARELWKEYHERDPVKLCAQMGIGLDYMDLGSTPDAIKGLSRSDCRCSAIIINGNLSEKGRIFTTFHEIGHIKLLHTKEGACACTNVFTRDDKQNKEIEANEFIAEYLMDTDETLEVLRETNSFFVTASILRVPPVIMDFKWRMLKYWQLINVESPIYARSDCMKNLDCGYCGDVDVDFDNLDGI